MNVQLLEARDLAVEGEGVSCYCCASVLHVGSSKADTDSHYLIDHKVRREEENFRVPFAPKLAYWLSGGGSVKREQ